jgi:hypothetical protein
MASNVITGQQWGPPAVGTRDGNWVWNGSNWVCNPDCGTDGSCPPFGPPVFSGPVAQPPWYPGANGGVSFGAVAPPNPVRGHMWWDGVTFWLFDGAAWVSIGGEGGTGGVSPGPAAGTTTLVFSLVSAATITLPASGSWQIVPFNAVPTVDTQGGWDGGTHRWVAKRPGYYLFYGRNFLSGATGQTQAGNAILKNDNGTFLTSSQTYCAINWATGTGTVNDYLISSGVQQMNGTTDFARMWAWAAPDTAFNILSSTNPTMEIYAMP